MSSQKVDKSVKDAKKKVSEKLAAAKEEAKDTLDLIDKKDIEKKIDQAENAIVALVKKVGNFFGYVANTAAQTAGNVGYKTKEELKNPVVATQAVITSGLIAGGIYAYQERFRIKRIPDDVLYVYAGVITGFVVLDGLVFGKLYGKYKKN